MLSLGRGKPSSSRNFSTVAHALDFRVANAVCNLPLVRIEAHRPRTGALALGQTDLGLDPFRQRDLRRRDKSGESQAAHFREDVGSTLLRSRLRWLSG